MANYRDRTARAQAQQALQEARAARRRVALLQALVAVLLLVQAAQLTF